MYCNYMLVLKNVFFFINIDHRNEKYRNKTAPFLSEIVNYCERLFYSGDCSLPVISHISDSIRILRRKKAIYESTQFLNSIYDVNVWWSRTPNWVFSSRVCRVVLVELEGSAHTQQLASIWNSSYTNTISIFSFAVNIEESPLGLYDFVFFVLY